MSRSERVETSDACGISTRWSVHPVVADLLVTVEQESKAEFSAAGIPWPGLFIISGYRSPAEQAVVNPDNPGSLHVRCPALAVDLRLGDIPATLVPIEMWARVGQVWKRHGGKWGGDFNPPDPNHFSIPGLI